MAILENLLSSLFGGDDDDRKIKSSERPCSNCPSNCALYPNACSVCKEYKEKLIDALYNVEHLDEFYARYEVVNEASNATGNVFCPACGAPNSAALYACAYCGTQLREGSGKILVRSAREIPDPIQIAQDIIFDRQENVVEQSVSDDTGLLESLSNLLGGDDVDDFGDRMSTDEIKEMAKSYGVSVAQYLQGLDVGKYLTMSAKKQNTYRTASSSSAFGTSSAAGIGTALGAGTIASMLLGRSNTTASNSTSLFGRSGSSRISTINQRMRQMPNQRPPMPPQPPVRPAQQNKTQSTVRKTQTKQTTPPAPPARPGMMQDPLRRPDQTARPTQQKTQQPVRKTTTAQPARPAQPNRPTQSVRPAQPARPGQRTQSAGIARPGAKNPGKKG